MLVIRQKHIYRHDVQANRHCLYIFGDNLERVGYGGQAKEMRGEPNSFGIATKRKAAHGTADCYFADSELDVREILEQEFVRLYGEIFQIRHELAGWKYNAIIIPLDGIGTGLSRMPEYTPKNLAYINQRLKELEEI